MYHNHLIYTVDAALNVNIGFQKLITPDGLSKIAEKEYLIGKKDINFFMPDVSIPRFKVKVFADDNKIRNTNKIELANTIIFSEYSMFKNYDKETSQLKYTMMIRQKISDVIAELKNLIESGHEAHVSQKVLDKLVLLSKTNKYIYTSDTSSRRLYNELIYKKLGQWHGRTVGNKYPVIESPALEQLYLENPNIRFIEEKQVQRYISEEGIVIDMHKYNELCKLIDTNESDNVVLAMEIMANSNFSKSIVFIFMILVNRGQIMYDFGNVDHVNFKYLLNYFNYSKQDMCNSSTITPSSVEGLFKVLKEHNQFTKNNVDKFLAFYNEANSNQVYEGTLTNNRLKINEDVDFDDQDEIDIPELNHL